MQCHSCVFLGLLETGNMITDLIHCNQKVDESNGHQFQSIKLIKIFKLKHTKVESPDQVLCKDYSVMSLTQWSQWAPIQLLNLACEETQTTTTRLKVAQPIERMEENACFKHQYCRTLYKPYYPNNLLSQDTYTFNDLLRTMLCQAGEKSSC